MNRFKAPKKQTQTNPILHSDSCNLKYDISPAIQSTAKRHMAISKNQYRSRKFAPEESTHGVINYHQLKRDLYRINRYKPRVNTNLPWLGAAATAISTPLDMKNTTLSNGVNRVPISCLARNNGSEPNLCLRCRLRFRF